jgi:hypothetical protein
MPGSPARRRPRLTPSFARRPLLAAPGDLGDEHRRDDDHARRDGELHLDAASDRAQAGRRRGDAARDPADDGAVVAVALIAAAAAGALLPAGVAWAIGGMATVLGCLGIIGLELALQAHGGAR